MPYNSNGVLANLGGRAGGTGGDTGMQPRQIYYCGRQMNQCRCGRCSSQCGPNNGCPCNSCVELLGFKVNRDNVLCKRGTRGTGGSTGMSPQDLYYCGIQKGQCRCGRCNGRCGPTNGCPCDSCLALINQVVPPLPPVNVIPADLTWKTPSAFGFTVNHAVQVGSEGGHKLYVARAQSGGELIPGKYFPNTKAYFIHSGQEVDTTNFEVLMDPSRRTRWVRSSNGAILANAVVGGHNSNGERIYIGRWKHEGNDVCGKVVPTERALIYGFFKKVHLTTTYDILVY